MKSPSSIQSIQYKGFKGIETKVNPLDQQPGTLRKADGVNVIPQGSITFGPNWQTAWGESALATAIATALSGAAANAVHFVTVSLSGYTFLVAWEITAARPRGIWHVAGTGDPSFSSSGPATVSAPNTTVYRGKTNSLPWYGTWVQNQLWLGNGTDTNLAWVAGALTVLGPQSLPANPQDPSQYQFPPCIAFQMGAEGQVYALGNSTYPMRVWAGEIPNATFPLNQGIKSQTYSYLDVQANATATTGISGFGRDLIIHLNIGAPLVIEGYNGGGGGWKLNQQQTTSNASAPNPNCTRDTKISPHYLGSDLEFYKLPTFRGSITNRQYEGSMWRKDTIISDAASGDWNVAAAKPITGSDQFLIYSEKQGKTWAWLPMSAGSRQGLYCFDERATAITGPWRFPDFLSACQLRDENLNGTLVLGITRDGALLWADVDSIGNKTFPSYLTALPAACAVSATAPTPSAGIPYVGVDPVNNAFIQVLNGQTLYLANPWADFAATGAVTPTQYFNNASLAIMELSTTDMSNLEIQKELMALRTSWNRNSIVYAGVYCEVNGYQYGGWRGLYYPSVDWIAALGGEGSTARIRMIFVTFPAQTAQLNGAVLDFVPDGTN